MALPRRLSVGRPRLRVDDREFPDVIAMSERRALDLLETSTC